MSTLSLIFAGSGEFGLPTLRALAGAGHRIVQVISQPDKPAGRGNRMSPTPISRYCLEANLPLVRTQDINAEALPAADLLIVIAFGQKIAPHVVDAPRLGSVNLHASLLPRYRGAAPINWAILRGEALTGNSVIRLAQKMDAGAVLGQAQMPIGELETAGELHDRLADLGAPLVLDVVHRLAAGTAVEAPQDESAATVAPKLSRDVAKLDFALPATELALRIRGLYPWPGCHLRILDASDNELARFTPVRARVAGRTSADPGVIDPDLHVAAGDGNAIEIVELQPEGKRPMSLQAYRNGHAWAAGLRLVPA